MQGVDLVDAGVHQIGVAVEIELGVGVVELGAGGPHPLHELPALLLPGRRLAAAGADGLCHRLHLPFLTKTLCTVWTIIPNPIRQRNFPYPLDKRRNSCYNPFCRCECSSSGRAPPCQGGGSEFEPRHSLQNGAKKFCPVFSLSNILPRRRIPCTKWCHSQVVRQSSAKAPLPSSNLGGTSIAGANCLAPAFYFGKAL